MSILDTLYKYKTPIAAAAIGVGLVAGVLYLRPSANGSAAQKKAPQPSDDTTSISLMNTAQATPAPTLAIYVPLAQANLSDDDTAHIERQIANLNKLGHADSAIHLAFKKATHAKMSYRFGRRQPVSFTVVDVTKALPQGFILTGRQYEGEANEDGYDVIYRLYENPSDKARLEITQTHIRSHAPLTLISELYRERIDGVPVLMETWQDARGITHYHAEFVVGSGQGFSHVVMTAKAMKKERFDALVAQVMGAQK